MEYTAPPPGSMNEWTPPGGDAIINLGDNAGANKVYVKDSDGVNVAYIDSDGNLTILGSANITVDDVIQGQLIIDSTRIDALVVRKDSSGGDVFVVDTTNSKVIIGGDVSLAATKKLYFDGGSDTYLTEGAADDLRVYIGGGLKTRWDAAQFYSNTAGSWFMPYTAATSTSPAYTFNGDADTGIGRAGIDQLSIITGGVSKGLFGAGTDGLITLSGGTGGVRLDDAFGLSIAPQAQQPHIVDADGTLADITTKFNTLLADLEGFGLLASA